MSWGVFDIPEGAETAIIKINNPLAVSDPKAFVITLEQPGGVVVSRQEEGRGHRETILIKAQRGAAVISE